ncbi:MAG: efflux RND transporter periplasmic adaptor subunit [Candidatus Nanopelagicales bacterium]
MVAKVLTLPPPPNFAFRMEFMKKAFLIVIPAILLLFGGILAWHEHSQKALKMRLAASANHPVVVSVTPVAQQTWTTTLTMVGTVQAVRGAALSPQVGGVVEQVQFHSGDKVRAGQVLVTLDPGSLPGKLAKAQAAEALAQVDYARAKNLYVMHGTSQAKLDQAQYGWHGAKAEVDALKQDLHEYTITAPFSGVIGLRSVNPGEYIHPGESLAYLENLDRIYVDFSVPQKDLADITMGATVDLTIERNSKLTHYPARVTALDSHVATENRAVMVRALVEHPHGLLPGMFVKATLPSGEPHPTLAVPTTAVTFNTYGDFVYVVTKHAGKLVAHEQPIKVGEQQGDATAVVSGLTPGAQVVTAGQVKLHNGDIVIVNNAVSLGS